MSNDDDEYTWLDNAQDLGAWVLVCGVPALVVAVVGRLLGAW